DQGHPIALPEHHGRGDLDHADTVYRATRPANPHLAAAVGPYHRVRDDPLAAPAGSGRGHDAVDDDRGCTGQRRGGAQEPNEHTENQGRSHFSRLTHHDTSCLPWRRQVPPRSTRPPERHRSACVLPRLPPGILTLT